MWGIYITEYILVFIIMSPTAQASLRHTISGNYALMGKCEVYIYIYVSEYILSPTPQASLRHTVSLNLSLMGKCGVYTCHRIHNIYHNVTNC